MTLRIPYLLAAIVATASLFYLADTPGLSAAPVVSFKTVSGQPVDLAAPQGRVRLISFWAPDCPISERNMPVLSHLQSHFLTEQFDMVAIAMPYSDGSEIGSYLEGNKIDYPVAVDHTGEVSDAFPGVRFTPTTFLIDRNGDIVWKHVGRMTKTDAEAKIRGFLPAGTLAKR